MIDDNDETRWGSRWRGPVPAMQKKHQGVSSANCCWWLRQQELTSSPPSLLPFSCRWPSTRTRHWRETWCKALWLAERPMPSSTSTWAWLPPTLFFVSEILYKVIPFENTHCAAPRLLWQTYTWQFQWPHGKWCPTCLWLLRSAHKELTSTIIVTFVVREPWVEGVTA